MKVRTSALCGILSYLVGFLCVFGFFCLLAVIFCGCVVFFVLFGFVLCVCVFVSLFFIVCVGVLCEFWFWVSSNLRQPECSCAVQVCHTWLMKSDVHLS